SVASLTSRTPLASQGGRVSGGEHSTSSPNRDKIRIFNENGRSTEGKAFAWHAAGLNEHRRLFAARDCARGRRRRRAGGDRAGRLSSHVHPPRRSCAGRTAARPAGGVPSNRPGNT